MATETTTGETHEIETGDRVYTTSPGPFESVLYEVTRVWYDESTERLKANLETVLRGGESDRHCLPVEILSKADGSRSVYADTHESPSYIASGRYIKTDSDEFCPYCGSNVRTYSHHKAAGVAHESCDTCGHTFHEG